MAGCHHGHAWHVASGIIIEVVVFRKKKNKNKNKKHTWVLAAPPHPNLSHGSVVVLMMWQLAVGSCCSGWWAV